MAKKFKVVQKFVVMSDFFTEVKSFSDQGNAELFATQLNDIHEAALEEGIKKGRTEGMMEAIREKSRTDIPSTNVDV